MQVAKDWLEQNKFLPSLSMKKSGEYVFAILDGEKVEFTDPRGQKKTGLKLYVVHDKQLKSLLTASYQLIQYLADVEEGSVVKVTKKYINEKTVYDLEVLKNPEEVKKDLEPYFQQLEEYKKGRGLQKEAEEAVVDIEEEIEKEVEDSVF